jgi:signal peptidase I
MSTTLLSWIRSAISICLSAFLIIAGLQTFVAAPFRVEQRSMYPTVVEGEYLLVDRITPHLTGYGYGDIVVFHPPAEGGWQTTEAAYIKRVVGLPGDVVELVAGALFRNGTRVDESYLPPEVTETNALTQTTRWEVPAGSVFVMGDNRPVSDDSRAHGPIPIERIVGRALLRYMPLDRATVLLPAR